jgi:hypothetical protein
MTPAVSNPAGTRWGAGALLTFGDSGGCQGLALMPRAQSGSIPAPCTSGSALPLSCTTTSHAHFLLVTMTKGWCVPEILGNCACALLSPRPFKWRVRHGTRTRNPYLEGRCVAVDTNRTLSTWSAFLGSHPGHREQKAVWNMLPPREKLWQSESPSVHHPCDPLRFG